jgi:pimeloyl-ACP methyl ester carboxylesterase
MTTLHHVRRGEGEPLLLLHSLGGTVGQWSPVLDELAAQRDVLAVDMPGFGRSPSLPPGTRSTAAALARATLDFCDEIGFGAMPGVAGISLGAWVALECARQGGAGAVVGLCPAGFTPKRVDGDPAALHAARVMRPLLVAMRSGVVRRRALRTVMHHPERMTGDDAVRLARDYAHARGYSATRKAMAAGTVGDLSDIDVPVTLAWAEHDRLVRRLPRGALPARVTEVDLPDCGHVPTWDDPALVTRVILEGTRVRGALTAPA